jgi:proline iminopeptidase
MDERGCGRSERLADPHEYTVENMVADVEAVRQALGFDQIDLLGHSYGGVLAQACALVKYQEHLGHLVLASTFPSTKMMNEVLAHERAQIPTDKLARMQQLEQAGLFGHGAPWEKGRYPGRVRSLSLGLGLFSFSVWGAP